MKSSHTLGTDTLWAHTGRAKVKLARIGHGSTMARPKRLPWRRSGSTRGTPPPRREGQREHESEVPLGMAGDYYHVSLLSIRPARTRPAWPPTLSCHSSQGLRHPPHVAPRDALPAAANDAQYHRHVVVGLAVLVCRVSIHFDTGLTRTSVLVTRCIAAIRLRSKSVSSPSHHPHIPTPEL